MPGRRQLCGREVGSITKHHLIPRTRHKNKRNKKVFEREDVRIRTVDVCSPCHKNIHAVLGNKELEREYNTLYRLNRHPEIRKFSDWVAPKPAGAHVRMKPKSR